MSTVRLYRPHDVAQGAALAVPRGEYYSPSSAFFLSASSRLARAANMSTYS